MNEGIIGIEGREKEYIEERMDRCPILVEGCLCVKNPEVSNRVCRDEFRYCPIYINLTNSFGTHIELGEYRLY